MSWEPELAELKRRQEMTAGLGGADKIERQHKGGRLTVRERIDRLLDPGSFHEIGQIAGKATYDGRNDLEHLLPSNNVMGRGKIDGRPVVVAGDDFTVRGGSADSSIKVKNTYPEVMANQLRLPIIRMIEGSGGGGSVRTIETTGRANLPGGIGQDTGFHQLAANLSTVPVVTLGLGSVAGLGAARMAASHFAIMAKDISAMFVAGPPLVARLGQPMTKQELGGPEVHARNGAVDFVAEDEDDAFAAARRFLSYLPSSVYELPARGPVTDDPERREEKLLKIVPRDKRQVYKMRTIVEAVVDSGSFFEIGRMWGRPIITGFARIDGWPVALMASDPMHYGGAWTADAARKVERFVDTAQTFHLPVIYLADCPGFLIGPDAEKTATIRFGVRAMTAINATTVPWCSVIVRNAFGVAGGAHRPVGRYSVRYAWVSAAWGSLPLEGGIEAAYRAELDAAADPKAKLHEIEDHLNKLRSPFRTAETFWIEEMIDPRDTRRMLVEFVTLAAPLREPGPPSFGMRP